MISCALPFAPVASAPIIDAELSSVTGVTADRDRRHHKERIKELLISELVQSLTHQSVELEDESFADTRLSGRSHQC